MQKQHPEVDQLFRSLDTGDPLVLNELIARCREPLKRFCFRRLADEALVEEAVMDAFLALWENRRLVAAMDAPMMWLYKCASRRTLNIKRREERRGTAGMQDGIDPPEAAGIEKDIEAREMDDLIQKAVEKLSPRQRMIFRLSSQEGWSRQQIAKHCGLSESTVKNHLTIAYYKLRLILKTFFSHLLI